MKQINSYNNLKLLILSPIFPLILSLIIFFVYQIYFGGVNLCDDNSLLSSLQTELNNEIAKFNHDITDKEIHYNLYEKLMKGPQYTSSTVRESILKSIDDLSNEMSKSLEKISDLEKSIKKIDSNYEFKNLRPNVGKYIKK